MTSIIPLVASALLVATIVVGVGSRYLSSPWTRGALFIAAFVLSLSPIPPLPMTHYARVLTGDLSMVTIILLMLYAGCFIGGRQLPARLSREIRPLALLVVAGALILYPAALGATRFDTYAAGYYPVIPGPILLSVFIVATWRGMYLISTATVAGFAGYVFGLMDSDNLWDYLLDPLLTVFCLGYVIRYRHAIGRLRPSGDVLQFGIMAFGATTLVFAAFLGHVNPDGLKYQLASEGGFLQVCATAAFLLAFLVCSVRLLNLRRLRAAEFLLTTALLGIASITTALIIMSRVVRLPVVTAIGIYMLLTSAAWRYMSGGREFLDRQGIPVPTLAQQAGYLFVPALAWSFMDDRQADLIMFGLSLVWLLLIARPANGEIFGPISDDGAPIPARFTTLD